MIDLEPAPPGSEAAAAERWGADAACAAVPKSPAALTVAAPGLAPKFWFNCDGTGALCALNLLPLAAAGGAGARGKLLWLCPLLRLVAALAQQARGVRVTGGRALRPGAAVAIAFLVCTPPLTRALTCLPTLPILLSRLRATCRQSTRC